MGKRYNFNEDEINDMVDSYVNKFEAIYVIAKKYNVDESVIRNRLIKSGVEIVKGSPYNTKYWVKRGFSELEAKEHIKTLRPVNIEYWFKRGYSEEDAILQIEGQKLVSLRGCIARFGDEDGTKIWNEREELRSLNGKKGSTSLEYWINKGYSLEEAKVKRSERQVTFSKEICINKYGEEEGIKVFNERQRKWLSNYKKVNFSKISQDLFWDIINTEPSLIKDNEIYFATLLNNKKDLSGKNHEYRLNLGESYILPDFFIKNKGKIIEFDGTYFHRKTSENKKREEKRDELIINDGYQVLHVNEYDYKNNRVEVINKCIKFLKE